MRAAAGTQAPPREGGSKSVETHSPRSAYAGLRIFLRVQGGVSACPLARAKRTSNGAAKGVRQ